MSDMAELITCQCYQSLTYSQQLHVLQIRIGGHTRRGIGVENDIDFTHMITSIISSM